MRKKIPTQLCNIVLFTLIISNFSLGQIGRKKHFTYTHLSWAGSTWVELKDIDNDGDLDIFSSGVHNDEIVWSENFGSGIFSTPIEIASFAQEDPSSMTIVDINNDGLLDIVAILTNSDLLVWYENLSGTTFGTQQVVASQIDSPRSLCHGDFDNDGDFDIVVASSLDDKISLFKNNGTGSFSTQVDISTMVDGAWDVKSGDLDNDGNLDIVVAAKTGDNISWFQNTGGGIFGSQQIITMSTDGPVSIELADMDGDLDLDLVSASYSDNEVSYFANNGAGVFGTQVIVSTSVFALEHITVADVDNDLDLDIISASYGDSKLAWYPNNGTGVFGAQVIAALNANNAEFVVAGDLDNNGFIDLLYTDGYSEDIAWYPNSGGLFGLKQHLGAATDGPVFISSSDLNNDGIKDIVTSSGLDGKLAWYEGKTDGKFVSQRVISNTFGAAYSVDFADFDGDGYLDIIGAGFNYDSIWRIKNLGNGTFGPKEAFSGNIDSYAVQAMDIDGDLDLDVLVAEFNPGGVFWYENLGGWSFSGQQVLLSTPSFLRDVLGVDLDGDLDYDIVVASAGDNKISWYENLGGGLFGTEQILNSSANYASNVEAVDIDSDGDIDIVAASASDNTLGWYENLGGGLFSSEIIISDQITNVTEFEIVDFDLDNDPDIIVSSSGMKWIENLGGNFAIPMELTQGLAPESIATEDLDDDGDLDVIWCDNSSDFVVWQPNLELSPYQMRGIVYIDDNQNGIQDSTEIGVNQFNVQSNPTSYYAYTYNDGRYYMLGTPQTGTYQIIPGIPNNWSITSDSLVYNVNLTSFFNVIDSLDFGIFPNSSVDSLNVDITGGFPRCNDTINYWITISNVGTTTPSGTVHLELDQNVSYYGSSFLPDSIIGQNLYWSYDSLYYFEDLVINVQVINPDFNFMGDTLTSIVEAYTGQVYAGQDSLKQTLVCAYDPNDKIADPIGLDSLGYIDPLVEFIDYTIRFQNTGTDTAHFVRIEDQLDTNLVWTSLQPLASSNYFEFSYDPNGKITFNFPDINLPDSNVNFLGSQGFIKYRIHIDSTIPLGTSFFNTAEIFFDLNPAVVTNTTINTIYDCSDEISFYLQSSDLCVNDTLYASATGDISNSSFEWIVLGDTILGGSLAYSAETASLQNITLILTNDFCTRDTTFTIDIHSLPVIDYLSPMIDSVCIDQGMASLPQGIPSGGTYSGNGVSGNSLDLDFVGVGTHEIYYSYADSTGCTSIDTSFVTILNCASQDEYNMAPIKISPNPTSGNMRIEYEGKIDFVKVLSSAGGELNVGYTELSNYAILHAEELTSGIYIVVIGLANSDVHRRIMIKL